MPIEITFGVVSHDVRSYLLIKSIGADNLMRERCQIQRDIDSYIAKVQRKQNMYFRGFRPVR